MTYKTILLSAACTFSFALASCQDKSDVAKPTTPTPSTSAAPTPAATAPGTSDDKPTLQTAKEFLEQAEIDIEDLNAFASRAYWVNANFVTEDTSFLASKAG